MQNARELAKVPDNPKDALAAYILYAEGEYKWYEKASSVHNILWTVAQGVVILAGLVTAGIAGLSQTSVFKGVEAVQISLIVLPLIGTFASSFLLQSRVRDLLGLRERGRQTVRTLVDLARAEYAAAPDESRYTVIHRELANKLDELDKEQTIGFFSVAPDIKKG